MSRNTESYSWVHNRISKGKRHIRQFGEIHIQASCVFSRPLGGFSRQAASSSNAIHHRMCPVSVMEAHLRLRPGCLLKTDHDILCQQQLLKLQAHRRKADVQCPRWAKQPYHLGTVSKARFPDDSLGPVFSFLHFSSRPLEN